MIEAVELIVRRYFSVPNVQVELDANLKKQISDAVVSSDAVQHYWRSLTGSIVIV